MKSTVELVQNLTNDDNISVPVFGYELIRDILIPDLLGKETGDILYWSGKHMARKFPLMTFNEVVSFFEEAGWGNLSILKEDKNGMELELASTLISRKLEMKTEYYFKLETGFLAEQIQTQKKMRTEAYEEINKRLKKVKILVRWDEKDTDL